MKLGMISLGCSKNQIDTELFLGVAKKYNIEITNDITAANILVVNTCGFITSAKQEAISTILELCSYKSFGKIVIAMGCLVERYFEELKKEIPEVDFYFPIKDYDHIDALFQKLVNSTKSFKMDYTSRVITTYSHSAYLRIGDGCNNRCHYCAIPLIRGPFKSRDFSSIIDEAKYLGKMGVKEITLIAQDTTRYGTDIYIHEKVNYRLEHLLHEISLIDEIKLIRVLYLYPDEITDSLINEFKVNSKVAPYFDIPIQHGSNKILKAMNRRGSIEDIYNLINKIRNVIPNSIIRSTLITGFPSETHNDYLLMKKAVNELKFDRLGIFTFSDEEDTVSHNMDHKVSEKTSQKRYEELMTLQEEISLNNNQKYLHTIQHCLIDRLDEETGLYIGRNYAYAPDDVDGCIYITSDIELKIGEFYNVEIYNVTSYDLLGIYNNK